MEESDWLDVWNIIYNKKFNFIIAVYKKYTHQTLIDYCGVQGERQTIISLSHQVRPRQRFFWVQICSRLKVILYSLLNFSWYLNSPGSKFCASANSFWEVFAYWLHGQMIRVRILRNLPRICQFLIINSYQPDPFLRLR